MVAKIRTADPATAAAAGHKNSSSWQQGNNSVVSMVAKIRTADPPAAAAAAGHKISSSWQQGTTCNMHFLTYSSGSVPVLRIPKPA